LIFTTFNLMHSFYPVKVMKNTREILFRDTDRPIVLFFIGMAGCGKTTLIHRISLDLSFLKKIHYIINIDPASTATPYSPNIDIRDTVDFRKIMKDYMLGPNGAILASLNLFSLRFEQVQKMIEKKNSELNYILIDTPGQIEIFTWSASGSIISEAFSRKFSVILFYIVDTARTIHPLTFVSNVLYSCSILYKTRLPILFLFNKIDITSIDFLREWLVDHDAFDTALNKENFFASSFARSLALTLDNFHQKISYMGVSALTGIGSGNILNFLKRIKIEFSLFFQTILENNVYGYLVNLNTKKIKKTNTFSKNSKNIKLSLKKKKKKKKILKK